MKNDKNTILLFDWDGVIVDSNAWKWNGAWQKVFSDEPALAKIMMHAFSNDTDKILNRYQLLDETFAHADKQGISPLHLKEEYADQFGKAVRGGVVRIGLFPGAKDILKQLHTAGYRMYVISATLQKDLEYIAHELGVMDYFVALYGLPGSKLEHTNTIRSCEKTNAEHIVIGDGDSDRELAKRIDCLFIGISNNWNKWHVGKTSIGIVVPRIDDILEILNI
ncbi:HAD family hydrolase [Patescibacteria group bacterium]|nr:HAD family hydrolase [Patescibacteria group bacterium]